MLVWGGFQTRTLFCPDAQKLMKSICVLEGHFYIHFWNDRSTLLQYWVITNKSIIASIISVKLCLLWKVLAMPRLLLYETHRSAIMGLWVCYESIKIQFYNNNRILTFFFMKVQRIANCTYFLSRNANSISHPQNRFSPWDRCYSLLASCYKSLSNYSNMLMRYSPYYITDYLSWNHHSSAVLFSVLFLWRQCVDCNDIYWWSCLLSDIWAGLVKFTLQSVWTIAHVDTLDMPFYQYSNLCSYCTLYFCGFLEEKALNIYLHITHC